MVRGTKSLRTCEKGHKYYKSSDCPTCPTCQSNAAPNDGFLSKLGGPARSALEYEGIITLEKVSRYTEKEILNIHGIGPKSIPTLNDALNEAGLNFRDDGILTQVGASARSALEKEGITTVEKLASFTEKKLRMLHGVGPGTIQKLRDILKEDGRTFADE